MNELMEKIKRLEEKLEKERGKETYRVEKDGYGIELQYRLGNVAVVDYMEVINDFKGLLLASGYAPDDEAKKCWEYLSYGDYLTEESKDEEN